MYNIKQRNAGTGIFLSFITCGIYLLYWLYKLTNEVSDISGDRKLSGGKTLFLGLITCGIYFFFWAHRMGKAIQKAQKARGINKDARSTLYVVLNAIGFQFLIAFFVQKDLNDISYLEPIDSSEIKNVPRERIGNPITYCVKKAIHGVTFIVGVAKNDQRAFQIQKTTGDELLEELNKVQQESAEYKNQGELDDLERIRRSKEQKLTSYRYKVKDSSGKIISNTFEAPTKNDVRAFLQNEGYEVVEIKERSKWDVDLNFSTKIKNGDLSFMLTQLSTYIKAGIPLINSVRILAKQTTNAMHKKILNKVVYELVVGEKFSVALEKQNKTFPTLLINMVKTSEMTGDLPGTLDEMAEYYTEVEKSRKAMISALTYPMVILLVAIVAVVFVIVYVVPQFVGMFASNNAELPGITVFIIAASDFLGKYWLHLLIGIIALIIIYLQMFKRVKSFRKTMQTFYMHLPVIGNVIIYNEVSTLTRTFASLLNHSVFITDSMEILSKLSNNEIYKEIINRTLINLSKGGKISDSFRGEWAFPVVAYEMLVTGESTGQLAVMMEKVAIHYQTLHSNAVTSIKSLIEPVIICFLAVAVGFIIMSIIMPMFDLYGQL